MCWLSISKFFLFVGEHLRERCDTALDTLRKVRTTFTNTKGLKQFQVRKRQLLGTNFSDAFLRKKRPKQFSFPEKKNKSSYTHRFICLNKCNQKTVPLDKEKNILLEAGLGEKTITIPDVDIGSEEFRDLLFEEFPKLREGGGFMFAKCRSNSRMLEPLPSLCLTTPRVLRDRVGSVRTFIIPLQKDLDIASANETLSAVSDITVCIYCPNDFVFIISQWKSV